MVIGIGRRRAIAACAATVASIVLFTSISAPVGAQEGGFIAGEAHATADGVGFQIKSGGALIGFTLGRSIAGYQETLGTAEARALDLGVLPVLFGEVTACDATVPLLPKAALPPQTAVDSRQPDSASSRRTEVRFPVAQGGPDGPVAGYQDATASALPSAAAATDNPSQDLGLIAVVDPHTAVSIQLASGTREAIATSWASKISILGGLIVLYEPRWEAIARSGAVQQRTGSFTVSRATVAGFDRTADQIGGDVKAFGSALADLLSGLGVHLDYPTVTVEDNRVKVSPLQFRLTDPPVGINVIGPFLSQLQPLREQLVAELTLQDCKNASMLQLVDVVLQVLSGSGSLVLAAGGVDASTDDTSFPAANAPPALLPPPEATDTVPRDVQGDVLLPAPVPPDLAPPVLAESPPAPVDVAASSTTTADDRPPGEIAAPIAETTTPAVARSPDRSSTTAVVIGVIGLLGGIALALGDGSLLRRARRRKIT